MSSTITRRVASPNIARHRVKERDASRRDFEVRLVEDETFADALKPEFFGAKADVFSPGDRISVVGHELDFWAELLVIEADPALASVKVVPLLGPIDLKSRIAEAPAFDLSKIQIEQLAPDNWRLRQGVSVVATGFKSQKLATEHLAAIKAGRRASRGE